MKEAHTFQRIVSYILDYIIIGLIVVAFTFMLPNNKKYEEAQKKESTLYDSYLNEEIDSNEFIDELYEVRYTMDKEQIPTTLIEVVILFGYFAIFAFYNNGQTLGKKLTHIKVVSSDEKDASYRQLIGRTLIINGVLISIINILLLLIIKSNQYSYTVGLLSIIQSIVVFSSFIMIVSRKDKRGIHDMICKTKVVESK